jgi:hypothetical protein
MPLTPWAPFLAVLALLALGVCAATTVVYCAGEIGRTPRLNRSAGRDHWPQAMSVLMAGGGIWPGQAYGATEAQGATPTADPCVPDGQGPSGRRCDPGPGGRVGRRRPARVRGSGKRCGMR